MRIRLNMLAIGLVAMTLLTGCGKKQQRQTVSAVYKTLKVEKQDITIDSKYSATIRGCQDVQIYPQVGGTIQQICVTEGQKVSTGQTLFIIDQIPYQAALNTAEASLEAAKAAEATAALNYEAKKKLRAENVISDFDLQTSYNSLLSAKAQVSQANASVLNARNNLSYTVVKSPSNGVVGELPYKKGALVSASIPTPLTTVSDISQMHVYFSMTESQLLSMVRESGDLDKAIAEMPPLKLQLVDGSEYDLTGNVASASAVIDRTTGTIQLRAVFDNPNNVLHSGSTGVIVLPIHLKDQIVIPIKATVQLQNRFRVWNVDENGIAHGQLVSLRPERLGNNVIVTEGLTVGQEIVAEGAGMIKEGQDVLQKGESK
ncbi:MAG: efflux RND transporter periplasmic adaptor subunit [Bacteroidaceae bacterium]|nr:efflux RND transporter periplasmic adaptor subunit [Bacteroidaceae bacterium]